MQQIDLQVAEDHILSLTKVRKPLIAVEELIWNALDADANEVVVQLGLNQLEGLETISVSDDGFGIRPNECEKAFGNLGGSAKLKTQTTPLGRRIHGKSGCGRFKAFGIGKTVTWRSRYLDNTDCFEFIIKCEKHTIRKLEIGDATQVRKSKSGVTVEITDIDANYSSLTNVDVVIAELAQRFALYLKQYPGITIKYEDRKVDPNTTQDLIETYALQITLPSEEVISAELTVIEWKHPTERALFLCDADGFARHEVPARIQAKGFDFTAYLASERVEQMDKDGAFDLEELHPEVRALVEASRNTLRTHFRKRESERAVDVIREWQEEGVYPYEKPAIDILEQAERDVFNVCAVKVNEYLPDFESSDRRNKEFTFRLIGSNRTNGGKVSQEFGKALC